MENNTAKKVQLTTIEPWNSNTVEIDSSIAAPLNSSAFSNQGKNLCESKVDVLCGTTSLPCSG